MADPSNDSGMIQLTGKIMVAAVIVLFFVVVLAFAIHMYAKRFWNRRGEASTTTRRRLDFPTDHLEIRVFTTSTPGLDPSIVRTIPVIVFNPKEFEDGLECAVCLCEISVGEKARILPKCNHGFHFECIDMWFQSHSTCPLCRNPVADQNQWKSTEESTTLERRSTVQAPSMGENAGVNSSGSPSFPTNVLIWGNETEVSTLGYCTEENHQGNATTEPASSSSPAPSLSVRPDGLLVIDIPRRMMMNEEEEQKSPMPTRLRSLKRLLSGNRRVTLRVQEIWMWNKELESDCNCLSMNSLWKLNLQ